MTPSCAQFLDHLEELALGSLDEPVRTELLQHAAECSQCRARLDQLTWVTEQVLVTAPEIEPPAGFEDRVLARIDASQSVHRRAGKGRRWPWLVAAAVAIAFAVGGFSIGYQQQSAPPGVAQAVRSGSIKRLDGSTSGTIVLASTPRPHLLITMDNPRPSNQSVRCILIAPDGHRTDVGSWSYGDIEQGAWAVGIDPSLLSSARMEILDSTGNVVANAALD